LIEPHSWNNFLHLKIHQIYHEILESKELDFVKHALIGSQIGPVIIDLAKKHHYQFSSSRNIRHGYMTLVIRIGNLFEKHKENE
jgi:hypothetical protein